MIKESLKRKTKRIVTSIVFSVMLYVAEALQSDDTKMFEAFKRRLRRNMERFIWTENVEYETVLEMVGAQSIPQKNIMYLREAIDTSEMHVQ